MNALQRKSGGQDWFKDATRYWASRFPPIEARLETAFRFVELSTDNRSTYSFEFASILRDCGSVFGSVCDALLRGSMGASRGTQYNFGHYRDFLKQEMPNIHELTIQIRPIFPKGLIFPFEELRTESRSPQWWDAYNKVKHSEYDEFREGNLENCVTALAALVLLGSELGMFVSDPLFVNVGSPHANFSIDTSTERYLFPHA